LDGLLTAYNPHKFEFVKKWHITFWLDETHPVLNKFNVALYVLLRQKSTNKYFLFINCHILFNVNRGDIKLTQIMLIRRGASLIKNYINFTISENGQNDYPGLKSADDIGIIWAGDFNTSPQSPLFSAIMTGDFSQCSKYKKFEVIQFLNKFLVEWSKPSKKIMVMEWSQKSQEVREDVLQL
jgi:hypothetical protein